MIEVVYTHCGAPSEEALRAGARALAYKGSLPLPTDSRERFRIITNSVTIPREMTEKLSGFPGKFSLSQTKRGFNNAHVFSSCASFFDGVERICYLMYGEGALKVCEYGGRRSANYSALYPELARQMLQLGFTEQEDRTFHVTAESMDAFLEALQCTEQARTQEQLRLEASGETDSIAFKQTKRLFYNKVYWQPKPILPVALGSRAALQENGRPVGHDEQVAQLEAGIRNLAECSLHSDDHEQLEAIRQAIVALKEQLDILDTVCGNCLASLELAEKLGISR